MCNECIFAAPKAAYLKSWQHDRFPIHCDPGDSLPLNCPEAPCVKSSCQYPMYSRTSAEMHVPAIQSSCNISRRCPLSCQSLSFRNLRFCNTQTIRQLVLPRMPLSTRAHKDHQRFGCDFGRPTHCSRGWHRPVRCNADAASSGAANKGQRESLGPNLKSSVAAESLGFGPLRGDIPLEAAGQHYAERREGAAGSRFFEVLLTSMHNVDSGKP
jgi:hypothetical protein